MHRAAPFIGHQKCTQWWRCVACTAHLVWRHIGKLMVFQLRRIPKYAPDTQWTSHGQFVSAQTSIRKSNGPPYGCQQCVNANSLPCHPRLGGQLLERFYCIANDSAKTWIWLFFHIKRLWNDVLWIDAHRLSVVLLLWTEQRRPSSSNRGQIRDAEHSFFAFLFLFLSLKRDAYGFVFL